MPALLATPETTDGLYASIPGVHGFQPSSGQYKAVYDYEAQVSFLAQMSKFHIKQMFIFLIMWKGVLMACFFCSFSGRMSSL